MREQDSCLTGRALRIGICKRSASHGLNRTPTHSNLGSTATNRLTARGQLRDTDRSGAIGRRGRTHRGKCQVVGPLQYLARLESPEIAAV